MKARIFLVLALTLSAFAVKAQDPAIAGINPSKSPIMVNETTIIEADILNGSSNPIPVGNNATWTINLPPNIEVQSLNFDDPSVSSFLSVYIGTYDPVDGTNIFIISDKADFPGASATAGAYLAMITVKGVIQTAPGIPAPMSINAGTTPPVGTNNSGNDNAWSSIMVQGVLPVTLTSFTAQKEGKTAQLNWATTEETNSDYFEIQHSVNGKEWNALKQIASHKESTTLQTYNFTHSNPVNGENLYRLKMVDKDQTFAYSRMQSIRMDGLESDYSVYPNPVTDKLFIRDFVQVTQVKIVDLTGRSVYQSTAAATGEINLTNLATGIYVVNITRSNGQKSSQKIVISK
jgi:hypothetical protein